VVHLAILSSMLRVQCEIPRKIKMCPLNSEYDGHAHPHICLHCAWRQLRPYLGP
jgi:hypothetical protein